MGGNPLAKTYEEIKTFAQDVIDNLRGREPHSLLAKPFNDVAAENVVNRGRDYALILKSGNDPKIGAVNAELDKSGAPAVTMGAIQFTKDPATMKWSAGVPPASTPMPSQCRAWIKTKLPEDKLMPEIPTRQ